ncbi:kinase-like domain-containing protein [Sporodiniella umbellata]|nr:kinase-like domain-containing protein [Sporodiniella umbellata]
MATTKRTSSFVRRKTELRPGLAGHTPTRHLSLPTVSPTRHRKVKIKPTSASKVLVKDISSVQLKVEDNAGAWGYLVKVGGETYTLDRELDKRLDNEPAGYYIGKKKSCDIKQKGAFELGNGDIIHFLDPQKYNEARNPTYKFVKPKTKTTTARSVDDLYNLKTCIAKGTYGTVRLADCKRTKRRVAIKLIEYRKWATRKKLRDAFLKEISVCMSMPVHPCIIQISKVYEQDETMYIVMEYGKNGDLFESVASYQFKEYEVKVIFDQLAHSIAFLHEQNIVHRDIKLENVVIFDRDKLIVKLCDFGLSTFIRPGKLLETNCGTVMYAAPELIDCPHGYGKEVDVWSLGVLLYTALVAYTPFSQQSEADEHKKETIQQIKKGDFNFNSPTWDRITDEAKHLIEKMMTVDKTQRYTMKEVLVSCLFCKITYLKL